MSRVGDGYFDIVLGFRQNVRFFFRFCSSVVIRVFTVVLTNSENDPLLCLFSPLWSMKRSSCFVAVVIVPRRGGICLPVVGRVFLHVSTLVHFFFKVKPTLNWPVTKTGSSNVFILSVTVTTSPEVRRRTSLTVSLAQRTMYLVGRGLGRPAWWHRHRRGSSVFVIPVYHKWVGIEVFSGTDN